LKVILLVGKQNKKAARPGHELIAAPSVRIFLEIVGRPDTCSQCNRFRLQLGGLPVQILGKLLHPHLVLRGRRKARVTTGAIGSVPSPAGFRFQLERLLHFPTRGADPSGRPCQQQSKARRPSTMPALSGMHSSASAALRSASNACRLEGLRRRNDVRLLL
jgi:hypothetical protein